ncbi:hypothetical protein GTQ99_15255 [Kineococcus sp. T13]|uniref:cell wall-binding repeat-containing protein n=1 Tax=Kineococcus vitellinus TaxID=2696565 RepID=UPI001411D8CD|nr:cell wall-binding repeat-containing protein [Kineococcus vitellinus]NAZ76767.1 hypothetical protein [Kineococcus vitellinus]
MRATSLATLAGAALLGATVVTATSAAADSPAPHVERQARAVADDATRSIALRSAVSANGNIRLSGADRYETAAEISNLVWEPDSTVAVYLASGTSFPDALAMAPSTGLLGPLLLTDRDHLPAATRAELQRLRPCYVIVAGGTSAVSDAVFADAEQYADATGCDA